MLTALPPTAPPRPRLKTGKGKDKYYTLHTQPNNAFSFKIAEEHKTSIVGFKSYEDAHLIGSMVEAHYVHKKEWPDTREIGSLILASSGRRSLEHVYIQKWNFDDLQLMCTRNVLDMISVEDIVDGPTGYSFSGNVYMFEAEPEFYRSRFEELLDE